MLDTAYTRAEEEEEEKEKEKEEEGRREGRGEDEEEEDEEDILGVQGWVSCGGFLVAELLLYAAPEVPALPLGPAR